MGNTIYMDKYEFELKKEFRDKFNRINNKLFEYASEVYLANLKDDSEKIIFDAQQEIKEQEEKTVEEVNKDVEFLLNKERESLKSILDIDEGKMNEIVNLLAERIVK